MTMQTMFTIEGDSESLNYLQRLGYEIDSYRTIIDYLFTSHKKEPEFLDSEIFKSYIKKYETVNAEYSKAKDEYGEKILRPIAEKEFNEKGVVFNWNIPDFADKKVEITRL